MSDAFSSDTLYAVFSPGAVSGAAAAAAAAATAAFIFVASPLVLVFSVDSFVISPDAKKLIN